ncbi:unnamed protein product [Staurois parvus]|uniref:Uncharacterized protein n=1 Tax=Staurois parvus TaxID=386267 RepID=A0ABN9F4G0_9NEOB|nr:unnamed protein product [Staurois parvus]
MEPTSSVRRPESGTWQSVAFDSLISNRHTLPCATFRSPHTAGGFHFCHRVLYGLPLLLASTATLWLHILVLAP